MATIPSAHLTIAAAPVPGSVVVTVHGTFGAPAVASLQRVLHAALNDRDILTIRVDLHDVHGLDVSGASGLAAAAEQADQRGADLTLSDPPALLLEALRSAGLGGLVRMSPRPLWPASEHDRRQRNHPAGRRMMLDGPDEDEALGT